MVRVNVQDAVGLLIALGLAESATKAVALSCLLVVFVVRNEFVAESLTVALLVLAVRTVFVALGVVTDDAEDDGDRVRVTTGLTVIDVECDTHVECDTVTVLLMDRVGTDRLAVTTDFVADNE